MRGRLSAALGAGLLAAVAGFQPVAADPPRPRAAKKPAQQQVRKDPVTVAVENIAPNVLLPKTKKLVVSGRLLNNGTQPLSSVQVALKYGGAMNNRSELAEFSKAGAGEAPSPLKTSEALNLVPGTWQPFSFEIDNPHQVIAAGSPGRLGVHPLSVTAFSGLDPSLGRVNTFINSVPKDVKKVIKQPTMVSFIWPLIDRPHRTSDQQFFDDKLAASVATEGTGGRLRQLLAAAKAHDGGHVTLAVDPALIDDLEHMSSGDYTVGKTKKPRNTAAGTWLKDLKDYIAVPDNKYFLTPYADPDTVALVRARMGRKGQLLDAAYKEKLDVAGRLGRPESHQISWPDGGSIDQNTIDQTASLTQAFLLSSGGLPPDPAKGLNYTPSAATNIGTSAKQKETAIAFDETIQTVISRYSGSAAAKLSTEQRYLAETAMFTAEAPNVQRTLVVAPNRRWNPDPALAQDLLSMVGPKAPWMKPVSLYEIAKNKTPQRVPQTYVPKQSGELPNKGYLSDVKAMDLNAVAFSEIFTEKDESLRRIPMRVSSSYWRGGAKKADSRQAYKAAAVTALKTETHKIKLITDGTKSLAGTSATIPFSIVNELDQGPVTIEVRIIGSQFLEVGEQKGDQFSKRMTIESDKGETWQVPMRLRFGNAPRNDATVTVQIYSVGKSGLPGKLISEIPVTVETTGVAGSGMYITIGALVVLVLGVGFRGMRARKRRKEEEAQHDGAAG